MSTLTSESCVIPASEFPQSWGLTLGPGGDRGGEGGHRGQRRDEPGQLPGGQRVPGQLRLGAQEVDEEVEEDHGESHKH